VPCRVRASARFPGSPVITNQPTPDTPLLSRADASSAAVGGGAPPLAVVVLAGGKGKRLGGDQPKVLAMLCGTPALGFVLEAAEPLGAARTVVVACHKKELVAAYLARRFAGVEWVDQREPRGTGHAVLATESALAGCSGDLLVLFGDSPLVRASTLSRLVAEHRRHGAACTMAPAVVGDPTGFGRVVRSADGAFDRIVEEKDADARTRAIREVHCGIAVFRVASLYAALRKVQTDNVQGEYYLTDVYRLLKEAGERVELRQLEDAEEASGFNTPEDLLECRQRMRRRILARHQANGVEIEDPSSAFIDHEVTIGPRTRILPFTVIRAGVRIGSDCEVGPFTQLRAGTILEDGAEVGNFVEVKASRLGPHVKAKHLTYLGDATIGAGTNVGAGTITANYDGKAKHETVVGARAFIGSGTVLIAPVEVGEGAVTGAGAIVTRNTKVAAGTTVVGIPARPVRGGRADRPPRGSQGGDK
jgi:bifunctional UDP-N-acetylglucosamine pyrophosphorylase/glucosamine-1-phosphate N-acetyltransferase